MFSVGEMPEPRFSMGVVSFEGLIYVVGGCTTSSRHLADLLSYNPVTQEWTYLAPMQTGRSQLGVAILGNTNYLQINIQTFQKQSPHKFPYFRKTHVCCWWQ